MEIYQNLNWSRKTRRLPKQQLALYNFNFSDHEDDVFYQHLNEIDSIFVEDAARLNATASASDAPSENPLHSDNDDDEIVIDPRTNRPMDQIEFDYTNVETLQQCSVKYFNKFPRNSTISKSNHLACIRAITKLYSINRTITEADKRDIEIYQNMESFRLEERKQFHLFVQNYFNTYLVKRFSKVDDIFKTFVFKYEQSKIEQWAKSCGHKNYVLQSSLPSTAGVINETVQLKFIKVLFKTGIVPIVTHSSRKLNLTASKSDLMYLDPQSINKHRAIEQDANVARINDTHDERIDFIVHFSSLVYLMDNSLKSWNIQVTVEADGKRNWICIGKCLPRNDLNSIDLIKKGYKFCLKYSTLSCNKASWNLDADRVCGSEIKLDCTSTTPTIAWRAQTIENYLNNLKLSSSIFKSNQVYTLWNLIDEKLNFNSNLLIRSKYDAREHEREEHNLINLSSKIEFQSEFGAEVMTKTELIKEWLKNYINIDTTTRRIRIDSETGTIVSQKYFTLREIENDLNRLYHLNPNVLLNNLVTKLNLIKNFPAGEYLLQYNANVFGNVKIFKLYASDNIADSKLKLFNVNDYLTNLNLYNLDNNINQFENPNQIDDTEITIVHRHAGITPCAFSYLNGNSGVSKSKTKHVELFDEKKKFNERRKEVLGQKKDQVRRRNNRMKKIKRELRTKRKAEQMQTLNAIKVQEAQEQRQFEYEYNIRSMFDEHGNVRVKTGRPPTRIDEPTALYVTPSYGSVNENLKTLNECVAPFQSASVESSPRKIRKIQATPPVTPQHSLYPNHDINKTNYSILTMPSSSSTPPLSSPSATVLSSVESDNDLKIERLKNNPCTTRSPGNNKSKGKQVNSVLGAIRKSMRIRTVNKRRYF